MPKIWIAAAKNGKDKQRVAETSMPKLKARIKTKAEKTGKDRDKSWMVLCINEKLNLKTVPALLNSPMKILTIPGIETRNACGSTTSPIAFQ